MQRGPYPSATIAAIGIAVSFAITVTSKAAEDNFFENKVEPLLQEKCLTCHSHSGRQMEGGLTLDSRAGWATGGDRGPAIVPGDPVASLLIQAIRYEDPDLQMPPEEKLSDEEIAILVQWVQDGANDPRTIAPLSHQPTDWWSLQKISVPDVPGEGHPIDAFIGRELANKNLRANQSADRVTLIRRLYIDLHGFLPTPEEVQTFVDDSTPTAYASLIDRLLASPRYGERWARHWLDVVHFADTHGCEHDDKRDYAWRYRDYVIDRLNADVTWGQFIREQLAPDVFYPESPQHMAGLGFVAAGPLELSRAQTAPISFDYLDRDDMVTQTMAAFTSTTANCARCHTHKFDPISQEDYYALQAVFAGIGKGDIEFDSSAEVMQRRQELERLVSAADALNADVLLQPKYENLVQQWTADQPSRRITWQTLRPDVFVSTGGATLTKQEDGSILASGTLPDQENYTVTSEIPLERLSALRLEVLPDESLPKNGPGRAENGNLHLSEVALQWFSKDGDAPTALAIRQASADFDQEGWTAGQAIDGDQRSGWAIFPNVGQSHHIVFELETPIDVTHGGNLAVTLKQLYPPKHIIGRFRLSVTDAEGASAQTLPADVIAGLEKPSEQRTRLEATAIAAFALREYAQQQLAELPPKEIVYGVSSSWSHAKKLPSPQQPKVVHLLRRGAFDKPVREVGPGALTAIDWLPGRFEIPDPNQESQRRAALADWLSDHDNPLTWRSIVNRVWHYHFGRGLCDTPNDFGRMGSEPTHPELLDWLAVWFRDEANGSLKQLHRLILTSQTWQQSSRFRPNATTAVLAKDATDPDHRSLDEENRLLWRMHRQRMDADVFRDSVLRVTGRLDLTTGGPGIEQFTKEKGPQTTPEIDYSAYDWESPGASRRSIYRVVWRGIPDPFMEALDFPDLGLLAPKRGHSVSALQSLSVFNNDFVLHSSQWFAERVAQEHEEVEAQVSRAVALAWLRTPSAREQIAFTDYTQKHGLAAFCRTLLNSNEFLFVD